MIFKGITSRFEMLPILFHSGHVDTYNLQSLKRVGIQNLLCSILVFVLSPPWYPLYVELWKCHIMITPSLPATHLQSNHPTNKNCLFIEVFPLLPSVFFLHYICHLTRFHVRKPWSSTNCHQLLFWEGLYNTLIIFCHFHIF